MHKIILYYCAIHLFSLFSTKHLPALTIVPMFHFFLFDSVIHTSPNAKRSPEHLLRGSFTLLPDKLYGTGFTQDSG